MNTIMSFWVYKFHRISLLLICFLAELNPVQSVISCLYTVFHQSDLSENKLITSESWEYVIQ